MLSKNNISKKLSVRKGVKRLTIVPSLTSKDEALASLGFQTATSSSAVHTTKGSRVLPFIGGKEVARVKGWPESKTTFRSSSKPTAKTKTSQTRTPTPSDSEAAEWAERKEQIRSVVQAAAKSFNKNHPADGIYLGS